MSRRDRLKHIRQKKANIAERLAQAHETPDRRRKRMTRDHLDVLQNIEFMIAEAYREDSALTDGIVAEALTAVRDDTSAPNPKADDIVQRVLAIRELRSDVDDPVWHDALLVILDSVQFHSDGVPGSRDYLNFVKKFMP